MEFTYISSLQLPESWQRRRSLVIEGEITFPYVAWLRTQLKELANHSRQPVYLYIHASGTDPTPLFRLYEVMKEVKQQVEIITIAMGFVSGAAAAILCAGTPKRRMAIAHSVLKFDVIRSKRVPGPNATDEEKVSYIFSGKIAPQIFANHTALAFETAESYMQMGYSIQAETMRDYGLIDHVLPMSASGVKTPIMDPRWISLDARPQARWFPQVSHRLYAKPSTTPSTQGTGGANRAIALWCLQLAHQPLTRWQRLTGRNLDEVGQVSRLLTAHRQALEAELQNRGTDADVWWQKVIAQYQRLHWKPDVWQAVALVAIADTQTTISDDPQMLRQRLVDDVLLDTHWMLYNGCLQRRDAAGNSAPDVPGLGDRSLKHSHYVQQLLPYSSYGEDLQQALLEVPLFRQMMLASGQGYWGQAVAASHQLHDRFPTVAAYEDNFRACLKKTGIPLRFALSPAALHLATWRATATAKYQRTVNPDEDESGNYGCLMGCAGLVLMMMMGAVVFMVVSGIGSPPRWLAWLPTWFRAPLLLVIGVPSFFILGYMMVMSLWIFLWAIVLGPFELTLRFLAWLFYFGSRFSGAQLPTQPTSSQAQSPNLPIMTVPPMLIPQTLPNPQEQNAATPQAQTATNSADTWITWFFSWNHWPSKLWAIATTAVLITTITQNGTDIWRHHTRHAAYRSLIAAHQLADHPQAVTAAERFLSAPRRDRPDARQEQVWDLYQQALVGWMVQTASDDDSDLQAALKRYRQQQQRRNTP
ncbi:MAG: ATP-dependent Clp protease proteolytic subunit [Cyanobacteria bacterium J06638_22]